MGVGRLLPVRVGALSLPGLGLVRPPARARPRRPVIWVHRRRSGDRVVVLGRALLGNVARRARPRSVGRHHRRILGERDVPGPGRPVAAEAEPARRPSTPQPRTARNDEPPGDQPGVPTFDRRTVVGRPSHPGGGVPGPELARSEGLGNRRLVGRRPSAPVPSLPGHVLPRRLAWLTVAAFGIMLVTLVASHPFAAGEGGR